MSLPFRLPALTLFFCFIPALISQHMTPHFVSTRIGSIAVYVRELNPAQDPLLFLHGVYFDHTLWQEVASHFPDRTLIFIDMPSHGLSQSGIKANWTLADCAGMITEVLDSLGVDRVVGVGHSWGSMTLLRAAWAHPERFRALALCNMPTEAATAKRKMTFLFQHTLLGFRKFYEKQAAKALFGPAQPDQLGQWTDALARSASVLSNRNWRYTDHAVILQADDASPYLQQLKVPAFALRGVHDYVPNPQGLPLTVVAGGHVSPMESPEEVVKFLQQIITLN